MRVRLAPSKKIGSRESSLRFAPMDTGDVVSECASCGAFLLTTPFLTKEQHMAKKKAKKKATKKAGARKKKA